MNRGRWALAAYFGAVTAVPLIWAPGWWRLVALLPVVGAYGIWAVTATAPSAAPRRPLRPEHPPADTTGTPQGAQGGPGAAERRLPTHPAAEVIRWQALTLHSAGLAGPGEDWGDYPNPHYDEDNACRCPDHVAQRRARLEDEQRGLYGKDDQQ